MQLNYWDIDCWLYIRLCEALLQIFLLSALVCSRSPFVVMCLALLFVEFIVFDVNYVIALLLLEVALCFFPFELLVLWCELFTLGRLIALLEADC